MRSLSIPPSLTCSPPPPALLALRFSPYCTSRPTSTPSHFFSSSFCLQVHANKARLLRVITTPTITQAITQIAGSPACLEPPRPVLVRREERQSGGEEEKPCGLNALKTGCLTRALDTVTPRNNTRENSKSRKRSCHSRLSHMKG